MMQVSHHMYTLGAGSDPSIHDKMFSYNHLKRLRQYVGGVARTVRDPGRGTSSDVCSGKDAQRKTSSQISLPSALQYPPELPPFMPLATRSV